MVGCPSHCTANHYHTGTMFNVFFSTVKRLHTRINDYRVGCIAPVFLDEIYLQPSVEASNQRLIAALEESLERRFRNEKNFALPVFYGNPTDGDEDNE